jgi:hypothetical protein
VLCSGNLLFLFIRFYPKVAKCPDESCGLVVFRSASEKQLSDGQIRNGYISIEATEQANAYFLDVCKDIIFEKSGENSNFTKIF